MDSPTGHVVVHRGASLIEVVSHYTEFPRKTSGGGVRGSVNGFSKASRKRMMKLLNSLLESELRKAKLITLTYHRENVKTSDIKKHFKSYRQAMRRYRPDGAAIWKLEYQKRGSPHFHLLYFGRRISHEWIARTWNRIAEPNDLLHLEAGTQIATARHARNAGSYLTKYLGKLDDRPPLAGIRHWGVINRPGLPIAPVDIIPLDGSRAREIIRYECAKRSLGVHGNTVGGVDLFTRGAGNTADWIDRNIASRQALP